MKRVLVIGCSGSGKSTFSRALAARTGLPVLHLDQFYFDPGWKEAHPTEWLEKIAELTEREEWIMDGNYSGTLPQRVEMADTIFFLDLPTGLCLWRVCKRTLQYWRRRRPDSAPGCEERFNLPFLIYVANYRKKRRPRVVEILKGLDKEKSLFRFGSQKKISSYLEETSNFQ